MPDNKPSPKPAPKSTKPASKKKDSMWDEIARAGDARYEAERWRPPEERSKGYWDTVEEKFNGAPDKEFKYERRQKQGGSKAAVKADKAEQPKAATRDEAASPASALSKEDKPRDTAKEPKEISRNTGDKAYVKPSKSPVKRTNNQPSGRAEAKKESAWASLDRAGNTRYEAERWKAPEARSKGYWDTVEEKLNGAPDKEFKYERRQKQPVSKPAPDSVLSVKYNAEGRRTSVVRSDAGGPSEFLYAKGPAVEFLGRGRAMDERVKNYAAQSKEAETWYKNKLEKEGKSTEGLQMSREMPKYLQQHQARQEVAQAAKIRREHLAKLKAEATARHQLETTGEPMKANPGPGDIVSYRVNNKGIPQIVRLPTVGEQESISRASVGHPATRNIAHGNTPEHRPGKQHISSAGARTAGAVRPDMASPMATKAADHAAPEAITRSRPTLSRSSEATVSQASSGGNTAPQPASPAIKPGYVQPPPSVLEPAKPATLPPVGSGGQSQPGIAPVGGNAGQSILTPPQSLSGTAELVMNGVHVGEMRMNFNRRA